MIFAKIRLKTYQLWPPQPRESVGNLVSCLLEYLQPSLRLLFTPTFELIVACRGSKGGIQYWPILLYLLFSPFSVLMTGHKQSRGADIFRWFLVGFLHHEAQVRPPPQFDCPVGMLVSIFISKCLFGSPTTRAHPLLRHARLWQEGGFCPFTGHALYYLAHEYTGCTAPIVMKKMTQLCF